MHFDPLAYGSRVAEILALDGNGQRLMPLANGTCSSEAAAAILRGAQGRELFPDSPAPDAALAGLWLYFSCLEESHRVSQDIASTGGSYWHGIMHRQEPDPGNSGYWFRRVGAHPVFPALANEAASLGYAAGGPWDPFAFIDYCESARRRPGSPEEALALAVQRIEWQLLFDHCARPRS